MPLRRHDVVVTALGILDQYGLADLTMRRIAAALDVQAGALYHHVANKQTLLAALADEILAGLPEPAGTPGEIVMVWADAFRAALLAHRDGAELVASVLSMRLAQTSPLDHLAGLLVDAGMDGPVVDARVVDARVVDGPVVDGPVVDGPVSDARVVAATVVHLVLGHVIDEQGHAQLVELGVVAPDGASADPDATFAAGVRLLVAGLPDAG